MGPFEFVISRGRRRGAVLPWPGSHFFVGTAPSCALRLEEPGVAAEHLEIWQDELGQHRVRDVSRRGDLLLDGVPTDEGVLSPGGFLCFGSVELVLREPQQGAGPSGTMARASATPARPGRESGPPLQGTLVRPRGEVEVEEVEEGTVTAMVDPTFLSSVLPPGTVVDGRYEIIGKLAEGGMGEVYRARHVQLGKQLALKVMRSGLSEDPEFVTRFKREAVAASQIGQQNIIDVSDFGRTSSGRFYFVMEFVDGQTLDALVRESGALPPPRAVGLVTQVARALAAAHAQGIVHRDLKPENVMVLQRPGQPDFVKVLDFGVAKVTNRKGQPGQTAVGMVVGTPQYMAPEQAQGRMVDARSDVYALGLILYELLSGAPTFDAETPSMLMVKHVTEPPPPFPEAVRAQIPAPLQQLVFRMLEKPPESRPQGMDEVCEALAASLSAAPPVPRPITVRSRPVTAPFPAVTSSPSPVTTEEYTRLEVPQPPRHKSSQLSLAVVLGLAALAAVWLLWSPREDAPASKGKAEVRSKMLDRAPAALPPPVPALPAHAVAVPATPPAEPPAFAEPALVRLNLTSPEPLRVFEGDIALGSTPMALSRPQGTLLELTLRGEGYKDTPLKIRFESSQDLPVAAERLKAPSGAVRPSRPAPPVPEQTAEELKQNPF